MKKADQLLREKERLRQQIIDIELKLKEIQRNCSHDYVKKFMHQTCRRCNYVDSLYY